MEKEAGNKFVSTAVLWIAWGTSIFIAFLFISLIIEWLFFFGEKEIMLMRTAFCLVYIFLFLIAIFAALKAVKKHFPSLENVAYLKKTAVKFCSSLSGGLLIFNMVPIILLTIKEDIIINASEPILVLLILAIIISPILMIPYCRKKIDKLYPQNITEEDI